MPRIPVYERRIAPNQLGPAPRATNVPVGSTASGLRDLAVGIGQLGQAIDARAEDDAAIAASSMLADGRLYWTEELQRRSDTWKEGDAPLHEKFGSDFKEWAGKQLEAAGSEKARRYLRSQFDQMRTSFGNSAFAADREKRVGLNIARHEDAIAKSGDIVMRDPNQAGIVLAERLAELEALQGVDPAKKIERGRAIREQIMLSAAQGWRNQLGDMKVFEQIAAPVEPGKEPPKSGGFDAAVSRVFKHEGGYTASDGNSGAPANFGINQRANPDVDVKNLTKEQARDLYKKRYWDAIDGDSLAPALQATAMDAAVNQGPANAKKWIEQSGGDVAKFNALRRAHYEALAAKPEYARFRDTWLSRLDSYEKDPGTGGGPLVIESGGKRYTVKPAEEQPAWFRALPAAQQMKMFESVTKGFETERNGVVAGTVLETARSVVDASPMSAETNIDLPAAKAEALRQAEARVGKLTEQQRLSLETAVEKMASDRERDRTRALEGSVKSVFDELDKNGGDLLALQRDQPALFASLGRDASDRVSKYAGMVATGQTRQTDWAAYGALINDPAALKSANLDAVRDRFSAGEFAQLKKMQEKLASGERPEQSIQSDLTVVKTLLTQAKVTDDAKQAKFFSMLQQAIDQELAANPSRKSLKQSEIKALADDLLVKAITSKGILWDTKEASFNIEVPPAERAKIQAALAANGLPATDYEIMRQYRKKLDLAK